MLETINRDLVSAMKAKDKMTLSVLRMIKAAIEKAALDNRNQLTDDEIIAVINKQIKMRRDARLEFAAANREDLVAGLDQELQILEAYMPTALTDEEVETIIINAIKEVNAESIKDLGKVMKEITPKVKGRCEMSMVTELVKKNLST